MSTDDDVLAISIERASEQLRQEREAFDQQKKHAEWWFRLRMAMGCIAVLSLPAIMGIASYVLVHADAYTTGVVAGATAALFADVLGVVGGVWRISMNPQSVSKLTPVTTGALPTTAKARKSVSTGVGAPAESLPQASQRSAEKLES
jgi:uncharacterized membrane protein YqjE